METGDEAMKACDIATMISITAINVEAEATYCGSMWRPTSVYETKKDADRLGWRIQVRRLEMK